MDWTPGTAGTITATTLEKRTIQMLYLAQNYDNNSTTGRNVNLITSSRNDDTKIISVSIRLPANLIINSNGFSEVRYINSIIVPTGETFDSGISSGGTSKASNLTEALVECFQLLAINERKPEKNPAGNRYITTFQPTLNDSIENSTQGNTTLNISANLPSSTIITTSGVRIEGVVYLT